MNGRFLLGIDVGSSSVKTALLEIETGRPVAVSFSPAAEMSIIAPQPGFAEQDPQTWWQEFINAFTDLKAKTGIGKDDIAAIGISYQMHGLVCLDKDNQPLRSSIIWCDSRAVEYGNKAFDGLGHQYCLQNFLNSPGNFTASKLSWVKENEPALFERIKTILLPGDYIAMRLTGKPATTISGLSEGILWNFRESRVGDELLNYFGINKTLLADIVPTFGEQGVVMKEVADLLGIRSGIPVSYRAGDQPNNAYSLNVLEPGEVAATAGTSGVVYGITDKVVHDAESRVNSFVHVNHSVSHPRYGVLLCVNGTGSLNSWLRRNIFPNESYDEMNSRARAVSIGSDGLQFYPFGNGAERILANQDHGASLHNLQFNRHHQGHLARAAQEGIVFALQYGMEIMKEMGMELNTIRAGNANMFLSDIFSTAFAQTSECVVELYNSDGAIGAARAAGVGAGIFADTKESFRGMEMIKRIEPDSELKQQYQEAYELWKRNLKR